ncbi:MAG: hypothetical protein KatS3mg105_3353 [Gemmatales bacterium]|nr:MAG: hypothetical protein KatS3mg105_3353 [Gemmatales bacterium]
MRLNRNEKTKAAELTVSVAQIVPCTEAEGPGRRFAIWFQGCPLRCPGCCNPEMLPFSGGQQIVATEIVEQMAIAKERFAVEGVTFLGGEPLAHASAAALLAREARELDLTVMVFSGYTLAEIRAFADPDVSDLLANTDILVDGPFNRDVPETRRRWIGSSNQQVHFLSDRYRPDDPCWHKANTLEIRWTGTELVVNGFPAPQARNLWQRKETRRG